MWGMCVRVPQWPSVILAVVRVFILRLYLPSIVTLWCLHLNSMCACGVGAGERHRPAIAVGGGGCLGVEGGGGKTGGQPGEYSIDDRHVGGLYGGEARPALS